MKKFIKHKPNNEQFDALTKRQDEEFKVLLKRIDDRYAPRALEILEGRNRRVYVMRTYVIKVPRNGDGIADNDWEGSIRNSPYYPQSEYQVQYARTRMFVLEDTPIVLMERVDGATGNEIKSRIGHEPKWVWRVDGGQVGFNKRGVLVAYDYGIR